MERTINKTNCNIVVIGNVDSGKSTLTGNLIYKCDRISDLCYVRRIRSWIW